MSHLAYSPAKLIITGEYSVMYGKPALALPVHCPKLGVEATWQQIPSQISHPPNLNTARIEIHIDFKTKKTHWQTSWQQVIQSYKELQQQQANLVSSMISSVAYSISIKSFIDCAIYLSLFALDEQCLSAVDKQETYQLNINSNIPVGSGLGSSAATIAAVLAAIKPTLSDTQRFQLACQSEDFAHGKSGLLDPWITVYKQACLWQNAKATPMQLKTFNTLLINTGKPKSSTAECVQYIKQQYPHSHSIWQKMAMISEAIVNELAYKSELNQAVDFKTLRDLVRQNHQCLKQLGVVPKPVSDFIQSIEQLGLAAKITGAGAVSGDSGGVVIIFYRNDEPALLKSLSDLMTQYHFMKLE